MRAATGRTRRRRSPRPSTTWYLAEGSTVGRLRALLPAAEPEPRAGERRRSGSCGRPASRRSTGSYALPANSRTTIPGRHGGAGAREHRRLRRHHRGAADHRRAGDVPRPARPGRSPPGHESAGVTAPATSWFLAEGATGAFFDLFILIANPNDQRGDRDGRLPAARRAPCSPRRYTSPANGRFTIWVDDEQIPAGSGVKPLANVAVSSAIRSTNGVPDHRRAGDVVAGHAGSGTRRTTRRARR